MFGIEREGIAARTVSRTGGNHDAEADDQRHGQYLSNANNVLDNCLNTIQIRVDKNATQVFLRISIESNQIELNRIELNRIQNL